MISDALKLPGPGPSPLDILDILSSPLLPGLAPELVPFRDQAAVIVAKFEGHHSCNSCARNAAWAGLASIAMELNKRRNENPELAAVFSTLLTSAEQVATHV